LLVAAHRQLSNSFSPTVLRPRSHPRHLSMRGSLFPYGETNFKEIVADKLFFLDKTKSIEDLEMYGKYVKVWRPRRSGKSVFCSQLSAYYDIRTTETQVGIVKFKTT
jgi:Predicted AAA-ATPase